MLTKRIIPCLDIANGRVVKGINFEDIKDVGDPVECAILYNEQGADEITFLDINATNDNRGTTVDMVKRVAQNVFVPLTVGGGIRTVDDFAQLLRAGADKISVNSAAVKNPQLIKDAAEKFGSQCVVLAIDAKRDENGTYRVTTNGGKKLTDMEAISWAIEAERLGAGEILLNSIDADGTKAGFDIEMTNAICEAVSIPVIASGGCGKLEDFSKVFEETGADAALAASLFHYRELEIGEVKDYLNEKNIPARLVSNSMKKIKVSTNHTSVNDENLQKGNSPEKSLEFPLENLFQKSELIPAVVQDVKSNQVLMLAYMNIESLRKSLETGYTWFYSRSRQSFWNKGETSGHVQKIISVDADCDLDTLLIKVEQTGVACHTGAYSCFFNKVK